MASEKRLKELISITHKHGVSLKNRIKALLKTEKALEKLNADRRRELASKQHPPNRQNITMYDSVTVSEIPSGAQAVAGYVGGKFPTFNSLLHDFPHAKHFSIAVNSHEDAECLDIETGDATPDLAPQWVRRQHDRGVKRPVVYANTSTMPAVLQALTHAGIHRSEYRVWTAHYTGSPHIEFGSDATQYTDKALGRNLDASLCIPTFFD